MQTSILFLFYTTLDKVEAPRQRVWRGVLYIGYVLQGLSFPSKGWFILHMQILEFVCITHDITIIEAK